MFVNYDKCQKEIMAYEDKKRVIVPQMIHPIHTKDEALALLKCHSMKYY